MPSLGVAGFSGLLVGVSALLFGALTGLLGCLLDGAGPWSVWMAAGVAAGAAIGFAASFAFDLRFGRRARLISRFLEQQAAEADPLHRLPALGQDALGRAAAAINQLLANVTTTRANMIDTHRELVATQHELELKQALVEKTVELESRLRERALLFNVLRASATETELPRLLQSIVEALGPELRLRELAVLIREDDLFVIRGAWGFRDPEGVLGRSIDEGQGLTGVVARSRSPLVIDDVADEPRYLAFWDTVPREGSFAAYPIRLGERLLGVLSLTRAPGNRLTETAQHYLSAIADQMAMVIHHAQLIEELRKMSLHDELTGLGNRRLLNTQLSQEMARARRFDHPLSALVIDIDHFKLLNDRCGHATGDSALREVAVVLRQWVRRVDTVARVGGEEFVVLLPNADLKEAARVAEKLRRQIASQPVSGGRELPGGRLTVSVGVATLWPGEGKEDFVARADDALYHAKASGRNCVSLHDGDTRSHRPSDVTQAIRRAG